MSSGHDEIPMWSDGSNPWKNAKSGQLLYFVSAECDDPEGKFFVRLPMRTWDEVETEVRDLDYNSTIIELNVYAESTLDQYLPECGVTMRERLFGGLYETFRRYVERTMDDYDE